MVIYARYHHSDDGTVIPEFAKQISGTHFALLLTCSSLLRLNIQTPATINRQYLAGDIRRIKA